MRTHYFLAIAICTGMLTSTVAAQADLKYFPDPAYKRLNADDPPPMSEMVDLAAQGDTRAMFILGDMSEKGKGGLMQDRKKAREWFEESAMHGYNQGFIRLAAMAKHDNNPKEAWQWYTLAINGFDSGDAQDYAIRARKALVTSTGLSPDDINQARKAVDDWQDARDKHLRAEKAAEAEKERQQEEQAKKDAQAEKDKAEKDKAEKDKAEKDSAQKDEAEKDDAVDTGTAATAEQAKQDKKTDSKPDQQENEDEQN